MNNPALIPFPVAVVGAAFLLTGCTRLTDPRVAVPEALGMAEGVATQITGDEDARDRNIRSVAVRFAEEGWQARAAGMLAGISSSHGALGLAEISVLMAHQGRQAEAGLFREKGREAALRFAPNIPRSVLLGMTRADAAGGRWSQAQSWMDRMGETFDLVEAKSELYAERLRWGKATPQEDPPMWEPEVIEARCRWILDHRGDLTAAQKEMQRCLEVVPRMFPVDQPEGYVAVFKVAAELGDRQLQETAAAGAIRSAMGLARDMEDTGRLQAMVAEALLEAEDPRGPWMLQAARESCDQAAGYYQPVVLAAIAEVMQKTGRSAEASETWKEAWQRAFAHIHPRARMMNAVAILLSKSRAEVPLDPEDLAMVAAIQRGEQGAARPLAGPSAGTMEEVVTHLQQREVAKAAAAAKDGQKAKDKKP